MLGFLFIKLTRRLTYFIFELQRKAFFFIIILRWLVTDIIVQLVVLRFTIRLIYISCLFLFFQGVKSPLGITNYGDSIYPATCDANVI
jgi:hypothetical protein